MASSTTTRSFRKLMTKLVDFVFPPRCLSCLTPVERSGLVCPACWKDLSFVVSPYCACCGLPFEYEAAETALCGACIAHTPPFDRARTALAYDQHSKNLLVGLKHDRLHGLQTMTEWMLAAAGSLNAGLVVPVPLHRWRLLRRSYNQAALLAQTLAKKTGLSFAPDILTRVRMTPSQGGLSRSGRQRNVRGAFAIHKAWQEKLSGQRVVLVDDVFTTGATLAECCRVLRRAGAVHITVLTVARVLKPMA